MQRRSLFRGTGLLAGWAAFARRGLAATTARAVPAPETDFDEEGFDEQLDEGAYGDAAMAKGDFDEMTAEDFVAFDDAHGGKVGKAAFAAGDVAGHEVRDRLVHRGVAGTTPDDPHALASPASTCSVARSTSRSSLAAPPDAMAQPTASMSPAARTFCRKL